MALFGLETERLPRFRAKLKLLSMVVAIVATFVHPVYAVPSDAALVIRVNHPEDTLGIGKLNPKGSPGTWRIRFSDGTVRNYFPKLIDEPSPDVGESALSSDTAIILNPLHDEDLEPRTATVYLSEPGFTKEASDKIIMTIEKDTSGGEKALLQFEFLSDAGQSLGTIPSDATVLGETGGVQNLTREFFPHVFPGNEPFLVFFQSDLDNVCPVPHKKGLSGISDRVECPEPGTLWLVAVSLFALGIIRRWTRSSLFRRTGSELKQC